MDQNGAYVSKLFAFICGVKVRFVFFSMSNPCHFDIQSTRRTALPAAAASEQTFSLIVCISRLHFFCTLT